MRPTKIPDDITIIGAKNYIPYISSDFRKAYHTNNLGVSTVITLKVVLPFVTNGINFYRPQRSCEGYVFTGVCLSTGGCLVLGSLFQGGAWSWGGVCSGGAWSWGGVCSQGVPGPGGSALGGAWSWGGLLQGGVPGPGGCLVETPPGRLLLRTVRILLECILVNYKITFLCSVLRTVETSRLLQKTLRHFCRDVWRRRK